MAPRLTTFMTPAERLRQMGKLGPYAGTSDPEPVDPEPAEPTSPPAAVDSAAVRAWAAENGVKLRDRGPIPAAVLEQYRNSPEG